MTDDDPTDEEIDAAIAILLAADAEIQALWDEWERNAGFLKGNDL